MKLGVSSTDQTRQNKTEGKRHLDLFRCKSLYPPYMVALNIHNSADILRAGNVFSAICYNAASCVRSERGGGGAGWTCVAIVKQSKKIFIRINITTAHQISAEKQDLSSSCNRFTYHSHRILLCFCLRGDKRLVTLTATLTLTREPLP